MRTPQTRGPGFGWCSGGTDGQPPPALPTGDVEYEGSSDDDDADDAPSDDDAAAEATGAVAAADPLCSYVFPVLVAFEN